MRGVNLPGTDPEQSVQKKYLVIITSYFFFLSLFRMSFRQVLDSKARLISPQPQRLFLSKHADADVVPFPFTLNQYRLLKKMDHPRYRI